MKAKVVLVGLGLLGLAVTVLAAPQSLIVPLKWSLNVKGDHPESLPTVDITGGIRAMKILPFVDKRDKPRQIGENMEKQTIPILTDTDVAVFVRTALVSQLKSAGLDIVSEGGTRVLQVELLEFWATEKSGYRASVRARFRLADQNDKEIWTAVVGGIGENWGRSLKAENYNETFSNAIFEMIVNLLKQQGFQAGIHR